MRTYIENYNCFIKSDYKPINENHKDGEIIPHKGIVWEVIFLKRQNDGSLQEVSINRNAIIDLHDKIMEMESVVIEKEFISIPF